MKEEEGYNSGSGLGISTGQGLGLGWMPGYNGRFLDRPISGDGYGLRGDGYWFGYSDCREFGCGAGLLATFAWSRTNA